MDIPHLTTCCFVDDPENDSLTIAAGLGNGQVAVYSDIDETAVPSSRYSSLHNISNKSSPITAVVSCPRSMVSNQSPVIFSGSCSGETAQYVLNSEANLPSVWSTSPVSCLAVDNVSNVCAAATECGTVTLFEIGTNNVVQTLESEDGTAINETTFVNSNTFVAVGASPGAQMMQFDLRQSGTSPVALYREQGRTYHTVAIHPSLPDILATGADDGTITLWDSRMNRWHNRIDYHSQQVWKLAYHPNDANILFSISEDGTFASHDLQRLLSSPLMQGPTPYTTLDVHVNNAHGPTALVASDDESVEVLNISQQPQE